MQKSDTKRNPRCPRCGYDLHGVMSLWQESCPLLGKCSECGLDYDWSFIFHPEKYAPEWCVEFALNRRKLLFAYPLTILFSFMPWFFWRRIKMEFPKRFRRVVPIFFVLLFASYLCLCISQGLEAKENYKPIYKIWNNYNQGMKTNPSYVPVDFPSEWKVCAWAVVAPISSYAGSPNTPQGVLVQRLRPLSPPRDLLQQRFSDWNTWRGLTVALKAVAFPTILQLMIAFGFVLLPASRRLAKVLPQHIARITLYGLIPCAIPLLYMWFTEDRGGGYISDFLQSESLGYLCFLIMPLWLLLCWGFAISRHLRMRHAWGIAGAFTLIGYCLILIPYYGFMFKHWPDIFL